MGGCRIKNCTFQGPACSHWVNFSCWCCCYCCFPVAVVTCFFVLRRFVTSYNYAAVVTGCLCSAGLWQTSTMLVLWLVVCVPQVCDKLQLCGSPMELLLQPLWGLQCAARQPPHGVWRRLPQRFCESHTSFTSLSVSVQGGKDTYYAPPHLWRIPQKSAKISIIPAFWGWNTGSLLSHEAADSTKHISMIG